MDTTTTPLDDALCMLFRKLYTNASYEITDDELDQLFTKASAINDERPAKALVERLEPTYERCYQDPVAQIAAQTVDNGTLFRGQSQSSPPVRQAAPEPKKVVPQPDLEKQFATFTKLLDALNVFIGKQKGQLQLQQLVPKTTLFKRWLDKSKEALAIQPIKRETSFLSVFRVGRKGSEGGKKTCGRNNRRRRRRSTRKRR